MTVIAEALRSSGLTFHDLSVRFDLPAGAVVVNQWNDVTTKRSTTFTLSLTATALEVRIKPGLIIDIQWPLSNVEWTGMRFAFGTDQPAVEYTARACQGVPGLPGRITEVYLGNTQGPALNATGLVRTAITDWFNELTRGTRLRSRGYNPLRDANPRATLNELAARWQATPSKSKLTKANLTGLKGETTLSLNSTIQRSTPEGGIEISSGSLITASAGLAGTAADVVRRNVRINSIHISSQGIFVLKDGKAVLQLTELEVLRGGRVEVRGYKAMESVERAEKAESGVRSLLMQLGVAGMQAGVQGADLLVRMGSSDGTNNDARPDVVRNMARSTVSNALTSAVQELYRTHHSELTSILPEGVRPGELFGMPF